ncbi:MAG: hypothetical protein KJO66_02365, partial [Gammaproteobacteria bacterium]|nr:hypothetical protein [Gammaproteobacteria bacterium]
MKTLASLIGPTCSLPCTGRAPDQSPLATQDVASVAAQLRVPEPPTGIASGEIAKSRVGAGLGALVTSTVTVSLAVPPAPEQLSVKLLLAVSGPTDWLPDVPLLPDQPPLATHDVASLELQLSVLVPPDSTVSGFAPSVTVGAGAGALVTSTVTVSLAVPPAPEQLSVKLLLAVSGPTDWLPEGFFLPDQPPLATHVVASLELQLSVLVPPESTVSGFAPSVTAGAGLGALVTSTVTVSLTVQPAPEQLSVKLL